MKKISILFIAFSLFVLANCANEKQEALIGNWQAIGWTVDGEESKRDISSIKFEFKLDGNYNANWGLQSEKGTYEVKGDKLYTTGEGQIKKMVKFSISNMDTVVMDMNRVGTPELLVLVRK